MNKNILVAVAVLLCAGLFGCKNEQKTTLNTLPTNPGETESDIETETTGEENDSKVEVDNPGELLIDEIIITNGDLIDSTDLIQFVVESDRTWEEVYDDFVLKNEIEFCCDTTLMIPKEQLDYLEPANGYDIKLTFVNSESCVPLLESDIKKMDEEKVYDISVVFRGSGDEETYKEEVATLLERNGIDATKAYEHRTADNFKIKLYKEDIIKLHNDPEVAYVRRVTFVI